MYKITIGCDPEFIMKDGLKCYQPRLNYHTIWGHIGTDCDQLLELRPKASENPRIVVNNIRNMLQYIADRDHYLTEYPWCAGSYQNNHPLGGHIHLGFPYNKDEIVGARTEDIILSLDTILAPIINCLEIKSERDNRHYSYGYLGSYNPQNHGIEYRTPASWIVSPGISLGVLCLAKAITEDVIDKRIPFNDIKKLYYKFIDDRDFLDSAHRELVYKVWPIVGRIPSAHQFYPEISRLYQLFKQKRKWKNGQDMKERWKIKY